MNQPQNKDIRLHHSTIEKLLNIVDLWGGHKENKKLKQMLDTLKFDVGVDQTGQTFIILKDR